MLCECRTEATASTLGIGSIGHGAKGKGGRHPFLSRLIKIKILVERVGKDHAIILTIDKKAITRTQQLKPYTNCWSIDSFGSVGDANNGGRIVEYKVHHREKLNRNYVLFLHSETEKLPSLRFILHGCHHSRR